MEKEFVPYELAVKLKELGFDEPCFAYYNYYIKGVPLNMYGSDYNGTGQPAPTWNSAFRWFRERYELGHMINGIGYESFIFNIGGLVYSFGPFQFKNYEEAELACLTKLIEIVEQKEK
jgi:hypothetical protein